MSSLPTNDTIYQSIHTSMCGTKPAEESNTKLPTKRWILYDTCLPHNPQNRVIFADKICPKAGRLDRQSKSQNSKFFKKLLCNQKWCQNSKWDIFGLRLFSKPTGPYLALICRPESCNWCARFLRIRKGVRFNPRLHHRVNTWPELTGLEPRRSPRSIKIRYS